MLDITHLSAIFIRWLDNYGALYHITSRGNGRANIFLDDEDRTTFLKTLEHEIRQQGWLCYAYCLMDNHYHLLIETPEPNLSKGMRRLNQVYTQSFNRRHNRVGHVFQGRYKAIIVDNEQMEARLKGRHLDNVPKEQTQPTRMEKNRYYLLVR